MSLRTHRTTPDSPISAQTSPQEGTRTHGLSRRDALKLLAGLGSAAAFLSPAVALAKPKATEKTLNALADAQEQYDDAEARLEEISANIESLSQQQASTAASIDEVEGQIADTEQDIADKQEELEEQQALLSDRLADTYKNGDQDILSMLLSTTTFEEFVSTLFYANKVSAHDQELIEGVRAVKEELEVEKSSLETQKGELEDLQDELETQLASMKDQKSEAEELLSGLDSEVQDLIAQRDAEILAAAAAEKAAQQQQNYPVYGTLPEHGGGADYQSANARQRAIVNACYAVASPGVGWCAAWVSRVYAAAGLGSHPGNADDMYARYCTSSNLSDLKVGMIIAVSTHNHDYAGRIYGHVGIYIGDGIVMHNVGSISQQSLNSWISYYGTTVPPRWGWLGNTNVA